VDDPARDLSCSRGDFRHRWRAVVDGGVVARLVYGSVALGLAFRRALRGAVPTHPLDLPNG
jgi:hypothetical protein